MTTELPAEKAKQKDGLGFRVLFKIAEAVGIGWQVMLVIIRVLGIIAGLILGLIVGVIVLVAFPQAHTLIHWAAFLLTPLIIWGLTELFIWFYSDPLEAFVY